MNTTTKVAWSQTLLGNCTHKGKVKVFEYGGITISAGGSYAPIYHGEIVLDCADVAEPSVLVTGPTALPRLAARQSYTRVSVYWRDQSIPRLGTDFWTELIEDVLASRRNLMVMCMGGHGRTGTALAILATLLGQVPEGICPVRWVRDHYCEEAVESDSQADYIERITGRIVSTIIEQPKFTFDDWKERGWETP